jgi:hypothetical protein
MEMEEIERERERERERVTEPVRCVCVGLCRLYRRNPRRRARLRGISPPTPLLNLGERECVKFRERERERDLKMAS